LGISDVGGGALTKHLFFFIPILFMPLIKDKLTLNQCEWVFWLIVLVVLVNIADNIRLCILHPSLMVMVNRDMNVTEMMGTMINIGGSPFYNGIFFFFTVCFFCFLNNKQKKIKYILLGCILLSVVFVVGFCLKASVILYTCLSAFLLFYAKISRTTHIWIFFCKIFVPVFLLLLFVSIFSDLIIEWIRNSFASDRLVQRLIYIIDSENSDSQASGTVNARERLWLLSIQTWLDNPINFVFGIGDHRANWAAGQTAVETGVGQHSDLFDSLARYGLIGIFLLTVILKESFKYLMSLFKRKYHLQLIVVILLFLLFGFTKGVFKPDIACCLFILLPLSSRILKNKQL
jgi:hypothetical protein